MLRDITIGQYFPGDSPVHRLDPRMKILVIFAYIILLFFIKTIPGFVIAVALVFVAYFLSKIPLTLFFKSMKAILPLLLFTVVLNLFFVSGTPVLEWGILSITSEGIRISVLTVVRFVCLIAGASLLTYTTSPMSLTDGIERLLSPLKKLHFPVHELAMMMTIALRFVPTLIEETEKIMAAQKARGADMDSGNIMRRVKALIPILVPLFVSAFRRAEELALAMESRCYHGGEGRTRMRQMHLRVQDWGMFCVVVLLLAGAIVCNRFFPAIYQ